MPAWLDRAKAWARALKREIAVLAFAVRDPRTSWWLKLFGAAIVAYALSPIDLIPDFIPVLGYLDELLLLPIALALLRRWLPVAVLHDARTAVGDGTRLASNKVAAAVIVALWIAAAVAIGAWFWRGA